MTRLLYPAERKELAAKLKDAVDKHCQQIYDDGFRNHLGASLIGHECKRYLWYTFRWVKHIIHSGRQYRLFNRGHKEEARFIEWLRGVGYQIWDLDENGKQVRITGVESHYGGSLDSVGKAPEWLQAMAEIGPHLVEYKTHNDKSFNKLVKEGVRMAKPQHWVQMCTYGRYYGFKYSLYCAINKNDDELHFEIVELDWSVADENYRKAEEVIQAVRPPTRLSELPSYFTCKFCDLHDVCHKGAPYDKNCRSCDFATPIKGGAWYCGVHQGQIPDNVIKVGCGQWKPVGRG